MSRTDREHRGNTDYARPFDDPSILSAEVLVAALFALPGGLAKLASLPLKGRQKRKAEELAKITDWDEVDDITKAKYLEIVRAIEEEVIPNSPELTARQTRVAGVRGDSLMLKDIWSDTFPKDHKPWPFDPGTLERKKG